MVGEKLQTFGDLQEELEAAHAPITAKYLLGKFILSGVPFDRSGAPYQDFALLIKLRNEIVHQKPFPPNSLQPREVITVTQRPVLKQLRSLGVLRKIPSSSLTDLVGTNWLEDVATTKMAAWACNVAVAMVHAMLDAIPKGDFRNALEVFYRSNFKRVRPSGIAKRD